MSADLFHEAATIYGLGGRLDTDKLRPKIASFFANSRAAGEQTIATARAAMPKLPPIHLDFVATNEVNAFAFLHKKQHFTGVTKGTLFVLAILFERMLSDQRILTHIGDTKSEMNHPPLTPPLAKALLQANRVNGPKGPTDQIRRLYCAWLREMAFALVLSHEMGHIVNGHVDRNAAKRGSPFIAEFGSTQITPEEAMDSQLMEMDADAFMAMQGVFNVGLMAKNPLDAGPQLKTYNDLLYAWLFAVFSFFRLFGDSPVAGANFRATTHPLHRLRVGYAWSCVLLYAKRQHGRPMEELVPFVWRAASSAERAFHILTGEPITPPTRYTEAFTPDQGYKDHRNRLMNRWNGSLRPELLPYAYNPPMIFDESSSD